MCHEINYLAGGSAFISQIISTFSSLAAPIRTTFSVAHTGASNEIVKFGSLESNFNCLEGIILFSRLYTDILGRILSKVIPSFSPLYQKIYFKNTLFLIGLKSNNVQFTQHKIFLHKNAPKKPKIMSLKTFYVQALEKD